MDIHLYKSINYSLLYLVITWLPLGYNYFFLFKVYNLFVIVSEMPSMLETLMKRNFTAQFF